MNPVRPRSDRALLAVLVALAAAAFFALLSPPAQASEGQPPALTQAQVQAAHARLNEGITFWRARTWYWQRVVHGQARHPAARDPQRIRSLAYKRWVADLWRTRAAAARERAQNLPHRGSWLCIHKYEGAWNARTGNGYYGGLQMDMTFQRTYGPWLLSVKGTADNWTPLEQMWVAERARASGRGWYPWPNTARMCGLI